MAPSILVACPKCRALPGDPCRSTKHKGERPAMRKLHGLRRGGLRRCACGAETAARSCVDCTARRGVEAARKRQLTPTARAKRAARDAVREALKSGRLVRPVYCACCGKPGRLVAHHASYAREDRLRVVWLLPRCHSRLHARLRADARKARAA